MNTCIETQLEELTKRVQALEQNITFVPGLTPVTASGAGTKHTPGPWPIEYMTEGQFKYSPRICVGPAGPSLATGAQGLGAGLQQLLR